MWHCPHCGAPQAETARCWVCRRSSTTCSTCRHFRTSLAADVGYCGNDRWRTPLTGLELRACWEEGRRSATTLPAPVPGDALPDDGRSRRPSTFVRGDGGPLDRPNPMRLRGFVPVEELALQPDPAPLEPAPPGAAGAPAMPPPVLMDALDDWERRVSLFGEAEG